MTLYVLLKFSRILKLFKFLLNRAENRDYLTLLRFAIVLYAVVTATTDHAAAFSFERGLEFTQFTMLRLKKSIYLELGAQNGLYLQLE